MREGIKGRLTDNRLRLLLLGLIALGATFMDLRLPMKRDVYRFVFVFDITQSMNVTDAGSGTKYARRLELARRAARQTLEGLPCGSELGLALFAEYRAFLLFSPVEVCDNYAAITQMLERIDWRMAWAGSSEVAKGLHSSLLLTKELGEGTRLVFFSDGHEAPPINPRHRPKFRGKAGETGGVVVGVGGPVPTPIPRLDADGQLVGYWKASEVMQIDTYTLGRSLYTSDASTTSNTELQNRIAAGKEHLSSLRESYLQRLAVETALEYTRLDDANTLAKELLQPTLATRIESNVDVRWMFGLGALLMITCVYAGDLLGGRRRRIASTRNKGDPQSV